MLWLCGRPVATAPIRPLAWEPPHAKGAALESGKKGRGGGGRGNPTAWRGLFDPRPRKSPYAVGLAITKKKERSRCHLVSQSMSTQNQEHFIYSVARKVTATDRELGKKRGSGDLGPKKCKLK